MKKGGEEVRIEFTGDKKKPVAFLSSDGGYRHLVMPMTTAPGRGS